MKAPTVQELLAAADAHQQAVAGIAVSPCPFCGRDEAKIERTLAFWYVICEIACNACGPSAETPEEAARLWNERKP